MGGAREGRGREEEEEEEVLLTVYNKWEERGEGEGREGEGREKGGRREGGNDSRVSRPGVFKSVVEQKRERD